jgi:hypothetical protein
MQEKKNKRLAILFIALCCVTATVFYLGRDGTIDVDKNMFKDYDLKSIDQIVLESRNSRVELKFNGARWVVNNQFDADASLIEVLFATLQQAEPKRPLAASIQDSVSRELKRNGVKVMLNSSGKTESVFYAGGNAQKTRAFFYTDDRKPYLVTIPGYRVYVSGIFELPEKDWKNKYVFGFNWRNFQRLEANFPQRPSDNFEVAFEDNYFVVPGLAAVDTSKLNDFLDDVSLLTVDEYVDRDVFPDSLSKPSPVMIITVKDIGQRVYSLEIYSSSKNGEMVPGLINRVQWAFFDPRKVQNIIRRRSFFEK